MKSTTKPQEALKESKRFRSIRTWESVLEYQGDMLWLDNCVNFYLLGYNDIIDNTNNHKYPRFSGFFILLLSNSFPYLFRLLICDYSGSIHPIVVICMPY